MFIEGALISALISEAACAVFYVNGTFGEAPDFSGGGAFRALEARETTGATVLKIPEGAGDSTAGCNRQTAPLTSVRAFF